MTRTEMLACLGSALLAGAAPVMRPARFGAALVLAGGGARGAYEAGVIEGLRNAANIVDGQPIPGVDVVCGTSIGAFNGWFLATAQYSKLAQLWHGVSQDHVFELKRQFAAISNPHAFVLNRIVQALSLARGLTTNVAGILDGGNVRQWILKHVDPATPVVIPLCFTATNLDRARAELFLRLPFVPTEDQRNVALDRFRFAVGLDVSIRLADDALLLSALQASGTMPILLDPIVMPTREGTLDRFVDGGVADNDPIDVGRALALVVRSVLLDPVVSARDPYANALQVGVGAFSVAEQRIIASSLRAAYLETQGKRLFGHSTETPEQKSFLDAVLDVDLSVLRPAAELPVETVEFDRQEKIDAAYQQGMDDVARGFTEYVPPVETPRVSGVAQP